MPASGVPMSRLDQEAPLHANQIPMLYAELWDSIVDEVAQTPLTSEYTYSARKHDLGNCALVCKGWLYRSRQNLFCSIQLRNPQDIQDLIMILDQLSLSRRNVHHLDILHKTPYNPVQLSLKLSVFTALKSLNILYVNFPLPVASSIDYVPPGPSGLRRLALYGVLFRTFSTFTSLVEAFPRLTHLIWHNSSAAITPEGDIWVPPDEEVTRRQLLPRLNTVKLIRGGTDYVSRVPFYQWISFSPVFASLTSLTLKSEDELRPRPYRFLAPEAASALLQRRGDTLHKLKLNVYLFDRYWLSNIFSGLRSCTSLQKFSIPITHWDSSQVLLIDQALQHLRSPSLTRLSFSFQWSSPTDQGERSRGIALGTILDDRLSDDSFSNLKEVTIRMRICMEIPSDLDIAQYFPRTYRRGILRLKIE
ncbi:hypothetical protein QCA50_010460 [Cerrena zonata]|uniref:F-box domain-containing protein n=1 Tax=Cerrena zonata TaxID=2478898 RepID=A0AAW0G509_9APHY